MQQLLSPAPVSLPMQETLLGGALELARQKLPPDDPWLKAVLDGATPEQVAKAAFDGTRLTDPAYRKTLLDGGEAAVQASTDPLVALVRNTDPFVLESLRLR